MFLLSRPKDEAVTAFLNSCGEDRFSYPEVGETLGANQPSSYTIDHNRQLLGRGDDVLVRAKAALNAWRMFDFAWVKLFDMTTPIAVDETVAILIEHYGFYSLNAARIVYTISERQRYGFAYGTLTEHGEIGEERFSVEILDNGEVWYDLYAFSRPGSLLARLGYPLARRLQKQFAIDSKAAMLEAVAGVR